MWASAVQLRLSDVVRLRNGLRAPARVAAVYACRPRSTATCVDPDAWSRVLARRKISWVPAGRDLGPLRVDPPPRALADHVDVRATPVARTSETCSGVNAKIDSLSQLSELAGIAEVCNGVCAP
jgi:hypothetical protein